MLERGKRLVKDMVDVLAEPLPASFDLSTVVYWMYKGIDTSKKFENVTITTPTMIGNEFPKTYGHYHGSNVPETYKLISGDGLFVLQRPVSDGKFEVFLVKLSQGEEITIGQEWGHSWSNVGSTPLITFDDWRIDHTPSDYEPMKQKKGMAVYLLKKSGEVSIVPNPNYKLVSSPVVVSLADFKQKIKG